MEQEKLSQIIEAVVFVSGESIDERDIIEKLEITKQEFNAALNSLKEKYNNGASGITLNHFGTKLQFSSASVLTDEVMKVICPIRERALSKSTIETLSIIAYKQPITRLEIEEVRGVSSDYALGILMDHHLIEVVGKKDAVGKPLMFGTTDEFLKRFNLKSLEELPDKQSLMNRIETIKTESGQGLYQSHEISDEEIIPEKVKEQLKKAAEEAKKDTDVQFVDVKDNYMPVDDDFKFV